MIIPCMSCPLCPTAHQYKPTERAAPLTGTARSQNHNVIQLPPQAPFSVLKTISSALCDDAIGAVKALLILYINLNQFLMKLITRVLHFFLLLRSKCVTVYLDSI